MGRTADSFLETCREAARHYDERGLAALLVAIATINVWNRLNVATKQVAFGALPDQVEAAS